MAGKQLKRVADLLSPEEQKELREDLAKIAETRRKGEAAANQLWL